MNVIHPTAEVEATLGKNNTIGANVRIGGFGARIRIGDNNIIHNDVVIDGFKDQMCDIVIGDNNVIHEKVRILVLDCTIGDDNVIHNHVSFMAGKIVFGSNCWIGQYTELDGTGGLTVEDHVNIGANCYVWTHANSRKLLPGCLLTNARPTIVRRGTWIVGCNAMVSPGLDVAERTILLPNAVLTKDTQVGKVYGGVPAKELNVVAWDEEIYGG